MCIFCGEKPESKSKEHVIPRWLIKLTGNPAREIIHGIDIAHFEKTGEIKNRKLSFNSFTLPACSNCNSNASKLEDKAKIAIEKILNSDYLNVEEIDNLLDWFDKVRIGLWLGSIFFDKIDDIVIPNFHINKRLATKDRCLFVYEFSDDGQKGIQFIGTTSPGFQFVPCCFTLRINQYYFCNLSFDFLVSKNIGFPYPKAFTISPDFRRYYLLELSEGTQKVSLPIFKLKIITPGISLFQPIIPEGIAANEHSRLYRNNYINSRLLVNNKGGIFYQEHSNLKIIDNDTEIRLNGYQQLKSDSSRKAIALQTLNIIQHFLNREEDYSKIDVLRRKSLRSNKKAIRDAHLKFTKLALLEN